MRATRIQVDFIITYILVGGEFKAVKLCVVHGADVLVVRAVVVVGLKNYVLE